MKILTVIVCFAVGFFFTSCEETSSTNGKDGKENVINLTIEYRGENDSVPLNPSLNWVFLNSTNQCFYIYDGTKWKLMMNDGTDKTKGVSIFVTFNNNPITNPPPTPTDDGTAPVGWHRTLTDSAIWISQKISTDINSGNWSNAIIILSLGGPVGTTGNDSSFVYYEGFKPNLKCATCHSANASDTTYRLINVLYQYEISDHKNVGNYDPNTLLCAGCHTNEGFYERYKNGFLNETFILDAASGPITKKKYLNTSPVGCFTCHSPHKEGDFSVRDSNVVKIFSIVAGQATKIVAPTTSSSICIKCHQPRMTSTFLIPGSVPTSWQPNSAALASDTAKIYTIRWNNHGSSEQTQTLLGFGGFDFIGYTYSNTFHTTLFGNKGIGCETCHMAAPMGNKSGGHTFKIEYLPEGSTTKAYNLAGCNITGCHFGINTSNTVYWSGPRAEIQAKIAQLGKMLTDTNITKKYSLRKNGRAVAWASFSVSGTDTVWSVANASTTSPLIIIPASKAGALWNLQFVQFEKSKGIHNLAYSRALLDASIAELLK